MSAIAEGLILGVAAAAPGILAWLHLHNVRAFLRNLWFHTHSSFVASHRIDRIKSAASRYFV
jgi:hypothetical protein